MAKAKLTANRTTRPTSDGLRDAFASCPLCGQTVLVQIAKTITVEWHNPKADADETLDVLRWDRLAVALDPVAGAAHSERCPQAADLRPLWVKDGKGGERLTWVRLATGELLEAHQPAA